MADYLDRVPMSGIIRIRDMMFALDKPFRLDQGDVSFDSPATVKEAMARAIVENRTHYVQTAGVPRLRELIAQKLQSKNGIPVGGPEDVLVTNGGNHALYLTFRSLLEPGDEVLVPDPEWPATVGHVRTAQGVPIGIPLHEGIGWRYDFDELEAAITPKTTVLYLNSPHNPTGGVLTPDDISRLAELAVRHDLWVVSDEAYEDVVFEGTHVSIASLPGMYERTIPVYTFSKSYAMTGLRLGYVAIHDDAIRNRAQKLSFYTSSNISSLIQYGGIGALEGPQDCIEDFRSELLARRDLFYRGVGEAASDLFQGQPPAGAFYAFLRIVQGVDSWTLVERLIKECRIGCVPGVDFGPHGEGYVRFCFARDRRELTGALASMQATFATPRPAGTR